MSTALGQIYAPFYYPELPTPRHKNQKIWHEAKILRANDTALQVTAVSMTPLCMSQPCQWLRCAYHSGVNDTTVQPTLSIYSANTKP
jgi:hypothetical protein